MKPTSQDAFGSIESAQEFVLLLARTVADAKREIRNDLRRERVRGDSRRFDALKIAEYNVERLQFHVHRTSRILNDLRTLRRLLLQERDPSTTPSESDEADTLVTTC